jgi:ABC-type oligopeptide transport system ATPase subunit
MTTLSIDGVSKLYRGSGRHRGVTQALRKVSFDIDAGEVVTLIGESGSGKTTLGRIVLRLTQPTSGSVRFEDRDIVGFQRAELRDYYRQVQGVFQDPFSSYNPIYKADRVFELLRAEYFAQLPRRAWDAKIESALDAVALNPGDVLNKYPHQLSGGQQQRMLIARALLLEVKLLVADEVISMLDASTRVDVLNLLVSLRRSGLAILFITHDLSLGNYISDRTVILRYGAIVETGPTTRVFTNPQHAYTKMLLSAVPQLHSRWRPANGAAVEGNGVPAAGRTGAAPPMAAASKADRPAVRGRRSAAAARELPAPVLVECEPGHLVAQGE